MKIVITGANGFIGSHLFDYFNKTQNEVYALVRSNSKRVSVNDNLIYVDLLNQQEVYEVVEKLNPDLILHCAGSANVELSFSNPFEDLNSNYITTHNLLFSLSKLKMHQTRFILFSSAAVYGNPEKLPIKENTRTKPMSPYALHKLAAEECCEYMSKYNGLDTKVIRIFSAYGPGLKKQIFWDMYNKYKTNGFLEMWGTGNESRDYIYIDDLVYAVQLIATKASKEDIFFNVANGNETKIREVAEIFLENFNISKKNIHFNQIVREGDPLNWCADISKLNALGYKQKISLKEGIRKYYDWVKLFCN